MDVGFETSEFKGRCGICGFASMELRKVDYSSQNFELIVTICPNCGYRDVSIVELGGGHPVRHVVRIEKLSDLNILVYRSPQGDVLIPELGLELNHTGFTRPRITTVEGFLLEAKEKVELLFPREEAAEFLTKIDRALKGELKLTFILNDESGASWVRSNS